MAKRSDSNVLMISRNKHWPYIASYHGQWQTLPLELLTAVQHINNTTPVKTTLPTPGSTSTTHLHHAIDPLSLHQLTTIRKLIDDAANLSTQSNSLPLTNPANRSLSLRLKQKAVTKLALAYRTDEIVASVVSMQSSSALSDTLTTFVLRKDPTNADALYVHLFHEKIASRTVAASTTTEVLDRLIAADPGRAAYWRTRGLVLGFRQDFAGSLRDLKQCIVLSERNRGWSGAGEGFVGVGAGAGKALEVGGVEEEEGEELREAVVGGKKKGGKKKKKAGMGCGGGSGIMRDVDPVTLQECDDDDKPEVLYESQGYFLRAAAQQQYAVSIIETAIHKINQLYAKSELANEQAVQIPSTAVNTDEVMLGKVNAYKGIFNQHRDQIVGLAKKSVKDYAYFLAHFSCTAEPFEHNVGMDKSSGVPPAPQQRADSGVTLPTKQLSDLSLSPSTSTPGQQTPVYKSPKELCTAYLMSIPTAVLETRGLLQPDPTPPKPLKSLPTNASSTSNAVAKPLRPHHAHHTPQAEPIPLSTSIFEDPLAVKTTHSGTYHPLLMEAWFAIAINYMLMGDFVTGLAWHDRVMGFLKDNVVDGFPVFMTARCMSHSDYFEVVRMARECLVKGSGVEAVVERGRLMSESERYMMMLHTKRADLVTVYLQHLVFNTK
ncbi:hypothetical protein HDU98_004615 [Podochytrium sp. JEL0797]|nr:hypothetical protein HDU98_004615 [Podochytrium sp. JEL0797]